MSTCAGVAAAKLWLQARCPSPRQFRDAQLRDFLREPKSNENVDEGKAKFCLAYDRHLVSSISQELCAARVKRPGAPVGESSSSKVAPSSSPFDPVLAMHRQCELVEKISEIVEQQLGDSSETLEYLHQLRKLGEDICAYANETFHELNSAREGVDVLLVFLERALPGTMSASEVTALIAPLHRQIGRAADAITELL